MLPHTLEHAPRPHELLREVDRALVALILLLMAVGTAAVFAASPASAHRLSTASVKLPELYFYWAHLRWQAVGLVFLFGASALSRENARRVGIVLAGTMLVFLLLVPIVGSEVNGARRWINLGIAGFQPSEFLKPGFAILLAWIVSWRLRDPNLPVLVLATAAMGLVAALMMMQPDFGGTILFAGVWFVIVLLAGVPLKRLGMLAGAGTLAPIALPIIEPPPTLAGVRNVFTGGVLWRLAPAAA